MKKPCKKCLHNKGEHAWNPNYFPGGEWQTHETYPCQQKYCHCSDYQE